MTNLFNLSGPEFLVFYIILGIVVNLLLRGYILQKEKACPGAQCHCTDAYKLAAMRGGVDEMLKIVLFSLIDRGLLKASDSEVAAEPEAYENVVNPIEQMVVLYFLNPRTVQNFLSDAAVMNAGKEYCRDLVADGLMADDFTFKKRQGPALAALLLLIGVSATKIWVALTLGKGNILFLVVLTVLFFMWVKATWYRKSTAAGDEVLQRTQRRFEFLRIDKESIRPGGITNDATVMAALFGITVLPLSSFPFISTCFSQTNSNSGGSGGCGGGGCGGGCGGCGGCGG